MPVIQKFIYKFPDGVDPIPLVRWVNQNCNTEEHKEFYAALDRQLSHRQEAINSGRMDLVVNTDDGKDAYIWKNHDEAIKNKSVDVVWQKYWDRYVANTGLQFETIFEEVL